MEGRKVAVNNQKILPAVLMLQQFEIQLLQFVQQPRQKNTLNFHIKEHQYRAYVV
jgi:hypothetical protein